MYMNRPVMLVGHDVSPPPSFDSIDFRTNGTVRLVNTMSQHDFIGTYTLDGNKLTWSFATPDVTNSIEHELVYSEKKGQAI